MTLTCDECLFADVCECDGLCEYFYPVDPELEELYQDLEEEKRLSTFIKEYLLIDREYNAREPDESGLHSETEQRRASYLDIKNKLRNTEISRVHPMVTDEEWKGRWLDV